MGSGSLTSLPFLREGSCSERAQSWHSANRGWGILHWWSISDLFSLIWLCCPWKWGQVCHHGFCFPWTFGIAQTTVAGQTASYDFSRFCKGFIWTHFQAEASMNCSPSSLPLCLSMPSPLFLFSFLPLLLLLQHRFLRSDSYIAGPVRGILQELLDLLFTIATNW